MSTTFARLGVPPFIVEALARRGIAEPFAIQAATVADGLAGRDVCGRAPTGSGKTIAFGVPLVANTARSVPHRPTALVLAPTRELAEQITAELRTFSGRLRVDAVYGGVGYGGQLAALRRGVDVLVACPGRLEDLIARGDVGLQDVTCVVLDEADRMADMGFMPAVRRLLDQTSSSRQTLLFSATLDGDVAQLTREYQCDPVRHEVGEETPDVRSADHRFWKVDRMERNPVVAEIVKAAWPSIVFCRTRHGADRLAKQLGRFGLVAEPLHGGRSQSQRNRALADFAKGRVHALVATDVAARGIHVDGVASVVHYDPPEDHKAYVHRSGRTARAGAGGLVISFVQPDQLKQARRMQRDIPLDVEITAPTGDVLVEGAIESPVAPLPAAERPSADVMPSRPPHDRGAGRPRSGQPRRFDRRRDDTSRGRGGRSSRPGERSGSTARTASESERATRTVRRSAAPKAANRKARRAHLQPGAR